MFIQNARFILCSDFVEWLIIGKLDNMTCDFITKSVVVFFLCTENNFKICFSVNRIVIENISTLWRFMVDFIFKMLLS